MADIGNMHTDLVKLLAVSFWLLALVPFANCQLPIANSPYRQRIVEVLGVLGVDGAGKDLAEVLAALDFLRRDARINLLGSILDGFRILVRQTILRQDSVHLHVVVALLAQHVNDLTDHVLRVLGRPLGDSHYSLLAVLATLQFFLGYEDIVHEDVALRNQEGIVLLHLQLTYCLIYLVRQNLYDHSFLHVFLATRHHGHTYPVTIEGKHRVALRDEDGLATVVGLERVLAVGLADKRTLLYLRLQVQTIGIVADF